MDIIHELLIKENVFFFAIDNDVTNIPITELMTAFIKKSTII